MKNWLKVTFILCAFGTLREIRPSEPFVSEFLLGEWRNITEDQLNRDVYPVGTYSYLTQLVVVFLITDFLRFKPIIILSGLSGISVYVVLLWTTSIEWLQVSQFLYGLYMATEVAYFTYIYAKVDPDKYPRVTSYTRIASLSGRFVSGVLAQLLTYLHLMNYRDLNYITLTAQVLATFWALLLPSVQYSIYFHRRAASNNNTHLSLDEDGKLPPPINDQPTSLLGNVKEASTLIYKHARAAYTRPRVLAWSALYAVSMALFVQAQTYMQLLWREMQTDPDNQVALNGLVEAVQTLLGAGGAFLASVCARALLAAPGAAVQAAAMFAATYARNVYVSYVGYVIMGALYHYIITLCSAKIAGQLSDDSCFGLIFGINTLIGVGLQSILTVVLIQTLELSLTDQYFCISGMFLIVSIVWFLGWAVNTARQKKSIDISNKQY